MGGAREPYGYIQDIGSLVPRPHPLNGEKGLVKNDKFLGPDVDLAKEFPSPNQIVARVINYIPSCNPLHFLPS